jgi:hypothetical protein
LLSFKSEQKKGSGGHNKKKIFLTIKTFKSLCLKAGTKKADEIHDYYMKMEDMIQDIIHEESDELKLQLEQSNHKLEQTNQQLEEEKISKEIIQKHNEQYQHYWSPSTDIEQDILDFLRKINHFDVLLEYI